MILMHFFLMVFSLIIGIIMLLPTMTRTASTQYYLLLMMIFTLSFYCLFGLVVYCRCRFLLRVLSIASTIILGVIIFQFIMSYVSSLACRYDERQLRRVSRVHPKNCSGFERRISNDSAYQCRHHAEQTNFFQVSRKDCLDVDFYSETFECFINEEKI